MVPALILSGVVIKYWPQIMEYCDDVKAQFLLNWAYNPWSCLLPLPLLAYSYTATVAKQKGPRTLNYQERAIKQRDEYYLERMKLKKRGELDEVVTPKAEECFRDESYLQKVLSGKTGMGWGKAAPAATRPVVIVPRGGSAAKADIYEGMFDHLGKTDVDEEEEELDPRVKALRRKMEIRPVKAKGASYYAAQAGVASWFFMWAAVLGKSVTAYHSHFP